MIVNALFRLTDEELAKQIIENPYLHVFIGLESYQDQATFDPSMVLYLRKRLTESVVNDCNELIVRHGLNEISSTAATDHDDDSSHGGGAARPADQQIDHTSRPWPLDEGL